MPKRSSRAIFRPWPSPPHRPGILREDRQLEAVRLRLPSEIAASRLTVRNILLAHASRYPLWGFDDLYKLLHQGALGSEHALSDEAHARDWLARELTSLGPGPEEPLIDPISPVGDVVRIHLRPFAQLALDTHALLQAFIQTASDYRGAPDRISVYCRTSVAMAQQGQLAFDAHDLSAYLARMEDAGYPAVHHSPRFETEYRPAYRIVARNIIPAEIIAAA